jgi:hypothetical protein
MANKVASKEKVAESQGSRNSNTTKKRRRSYRAAAKTKARERRHLDVPHTSADLGDTITITRIKLSHGEKGASLRGVISTRGASTNSRRSKTSSTTLSIVLLHLLELLSTTWAFRSSLAFVSTSTVTSEMGIVHGGDYVY